MIFDPRTDQEFVNFLRLKTPSLSLKARRALMAWSRGSTLKAAAEQCGLTPARVRQIWSREWANYKKLNDREVERARLRAGASLSEVSIKALGFRAENILAWEGLHTLADVMRIRSTALWCIPNFGKKSYAELFSALAELGLVKEN